MEIETATWFEFLKQGKAAAEQMLGSEEKNKYKQQDCHSHTQGSE